MNAAQRKYLVKRIETLGNEKIRDLQYELQRGPNSEVIEKVLKENKPVFVSTTGIRKRIIDQVNSINPYSSYLGNIDITQLLHNGEEIVTKIKDAIASETNDIQNRILAISKDVASVVDTIMFATNDEALKVIEDFQKKQF